jgi:hypothetical protein
MVYIISRAKLNKIRGFLPKSSTTTYHFWGCFSRAVGPTFHPNPRIYRP